MIEKDSQERTTSRFFLFWTNPIYRGLDKILSGQKVQIEFDYIANMRLAKLQPDDPKVLEDNRNLFNNFTGDLRLEKITLSGGAIASALTIWETEWSKLIQYKLTHPTKLGSKGGTSKAMRPLVLAARALNMYIVNRNVPSAKQMLEHYLRSVPAERSPPLDTMLLL